MSEIPKRYLAWRRACQQGGRVCSPLFDTAEQAADWMLESNREHHELTLVELRLCPAPAKAVVTAIAHAHNNRTLVEPLQRLLHAAAPERHA